MTGEDVLAALEAAESDADVLAALAGGIGPDADAPSPEALAAWWPECPEAARSEAVERLQALARIAVPEAPGECVDGLGFMVYPGVVVRRDLGPDEVTIEGPHLFAQWPTDTTGKVIGGGGRWIGNPRLIEALARRWIEARELDGCPGHPLAPIVRAWIERPRGLERRHLIATREKYPPKGSEPLVMTRQPGIVSLVSHSPLEAVKVDGVAFATRTIGGVETKIRRYRLADSQGDLFPGPRTLAGDTTAGAIFEAVAFLVLSGDERSPLRADLLKLANLAFALTGPTEWQEPEGAELVGGRDSKPNRERFHSALWALRGMAVHVPSTRPHGDRWWPMAGADPDPKRNIIAPPRWWLSHMEATKGTKRGSPERRERLAAAGLAGPVAWRYTGCLFVPASKWGAVERTVCGLESALLWGSSAGAGRGGGNPDNVDPVRRGGPGPEVVVPWWQVLRLSGENVGEDTDPRGAAGRRYRRRCKDLESAGYFTARNGTASAGGTVEVVEQRRGSKARRAGLVVRASARFCAAYAINERVNVSAAGLLTP